jgi:hypothetical protein
MSKRSDYQKEMEERLELWSARLDVLMAKATEAEKTAFQTEVLQWKAAGIVAFAKLAELKSATGDNWDVVKREMGAIWQTIAAAIDKAELGKRTRDDHPDLWNTRLDALMTRATPAEKLAFRKEIEQWQAAGIAAFEKLGELRSAAGDNWHLVKEEMGTIWQTIASAIDTAEQTSGPKDMSVPIGVAAQHGPIAPVAPKM